VRLSKRLIRNWHGYIVNGNASACSKLLQSLPASAAVQMAGMIIAPLPVDTTSLVSACPGLLFARVALSQFAWAEFANLRHGTTRSESRQA
jgi:hypothetical protein